MITGISIENFKGIRERVELELKPLTLLFGPNSAGKSTILHALHYAREIFERHNLDADAAERQVRVTNNMSRQIQQNLTEPHTVDLYFWPRFLERILVAGNDVEESDGRQRKSPRWIVHMSHVAHSSDQNTSQTEWKLLRRERLDFWFRRFVAEDAADKPAPITIRPVTRTNR